MPEIRPQDRLICALDLPSRDEALRIVDDLDGLVSFYKLGIPLWLRSGLEDLLANLEGKRVFVDLKLPDDIGETIRRTVSMAASLNVELMTLSMHANASTIRVAREARGTAEYPKLLSVPLLSSLDGQDVKEIQGDESLETFIKRRARAVLDAGCDGLIASGDSIAYLREEHPKALIVSPGIRPKGTGTDDHKRSATPFEAITRGSDYLVVGRPLVRASGREERRRIAEEIIAEIDAGMKERG